MCQSLLHFLFLLFAEGSCLHRSLYVTTNVPHLYRSRTAIVLTYTELNRCAFRFTNPDRANFTNLKVLKCVTILRLNFEAIDQTKTERRLSRSVIPHVSYSLTGSILLKVYSVYLECAKLLIGCTVGTLKCFAQFYFSLCIFNSRVSILLACAVTCHTDTEFSHGTLSRAAHICSWQGSFSRSGVRDACAIRRAGGNALLSYIHCVRTVEMRTRCVRAARHVVNAFISRAYLCRRLCYTPFL